MGIEAQSKMVEQVDRDDKKEDKAANEVVDDVLASTLATTKELLGSILMPRNPKQVSAMILSDDVIRENVKYYLADDFCKGGGSATNLPDYFRQK